MPPGIHSKLGPSKSESWINCPPCLKLTEDMEDEPSEYASAGTAAHELAEYKGKKILGLKAGSRPHSDSFAGLERENISFKVCFSSTESWVIFISKFLQNKRSSSLI